MSESWTAAYADKTESERSWTQPVPTESLGIIDTLGLTKDAPVVDIGGGASYLVDSLVARGHTDVTLLDISPQALEQARARNGGAVTYLARDITDWEPDRAYALWHDRAVFHFLTEPADRDRYRRALTAGTAVGSRLIVATFAPDGPETCSGLPVMRWSSEGLADEFSDSFALVSHARSEHTTPWGSVQPFTFVHLVRVR